MGDLSNSWDKANSKYSSTKTGAQALIDEKKLKYKELKENFEDKKESLTSTIDKFKEDKKRFQKAVKTQMDLMLDMVQMQASESFTSKSSTINYIKRKFIQTAIAIKPKILQILEEETIRALGCSQQQTYAPQIIYLKVKSVDLKRLLMRSPDDGLFTVSYEKVPPTPNQIPFSMNRELWERLQNLNQPNDFYGASGQKLFTITYVQTDGIITGDFFKVELADRVTGPNKIADFIVDYYKSIDVVDVSNIFGQLMEVMVGSFSFEAKLGYGEIDDSNKFLLFLQRILGLCFDNKREIDVGGTAKVSELDNIDESFFEFSDIELRHIESIIDNVQNGVVEFENCDNVKLPINHKKIFDELIKFNKVDNAKDEEEIANSLTDAMSGDTWNLLFPNSFDLKLNVDLTFLKNLPKAIMMALLSPKIILPLLTMAKAFGQLVGYTIETFSDFFKAFKKYIMNIMSKIGAIFVKELFELIKRDILALINTVIQDLRNEQKLKKYAIILTLIELILIVQKFVSDWRKCKSVVDEILALLSLAKANGIFGKNKIPEPLIAASELLAGYSPTRAFFNTIENFQSKGLPTGPMPDGSPNLILQSILSIFKGQDKESAENGKTQVFVPPLKIAPFGVTLPQSVYGKSV